MPRKNRPPGLIRCFNPGSITSVDDMVRALELVVMDLFADVGYLDGRNDNRLPFIIEETDLGLDIIVVDQDESWKERELSTREAFGLYSGVHDAAQKLGLAEALRRLSARPGGLSQDESAILAVAKSSRLSVAEVVRRLDCHYRGESEPLRTPVVSEN